MELALGTDAPTPRLHRSGARRLWLIAPPNPTDSPTSTLGVLSTLSYSYYCRYCIMVIVQSATILLSTVSTHTMTAEVPGVAFGGGLPDVERGSVGHGEASYRSLSPYRLLSIFKFLLTTVGVGTYNPHTKHRRCCSAARRLCVVCWS